MPVGFYAHDGKVYGGYLGGLTTIQADASELGVKTMSICTSL